MGRKHFAEEQIAFALRQHESGTAMVDLCTGATVGMFEFTSGCQELFEVQFPAASGTA